MTTLKKLYPEQDMFKLASNQQISMFNKAVGSNKVTAILKQSADISEIMLFLNKDVEVFKKTSKIYYLYD